MRLGLTEISGEEIGSGTDGDDTLIGTDENPDVLFGGAGNDPIEGAGRKRRC